MSTSDPLVLPPAPAPPPRGSFPLVASLAPLVAALALWAATRSASVLVVAAFSPVIALATVADRRRHASREARRAARGRSEARERLRQEVERRHEEERAALRRRNPPIDDLLEGSLPPGIWRDQEMPQAVAVGIGAVPSRVRVSGDPIDEVDRVLAAAAQTIADAVVEVETGRCLGVAGPRTAARAVARAVVCRLALALPPGRMLVVPSSHPAWEWLSRLPHAASGAPGVTSPQTLPVVKVVVREQEDRGVPESDLTIAVAESPAALPPGTGSLLCFDRAIGWCHAVDEGWQRVAVDVATLEHALGLAERLARAADDAGLGAARMPDRVTFRELPQPGDPGRGLTCSIGMTGEGAYVVDLVADGPHAVVAGTTGSGKSELLITWVCAMAAGRPPERVQFLLIDFKGGAAFAPLARLPNCVGVISDLDEPAASRAIESLRAELRRRERALAELGASDVAAAGDSIPRLVVVVDEYASMVETFPGFHDLFADLTARGRSLGIHAVLGTQRPVGVVRDAVLANCPLRLSLRVTGAADSAAVVHSDAAAALPPVPGRCVVARAGEQHIVQLALTTPHDVSALAHANQGHARPPRPWLEPLATVIPLESLPLAAPPGIVLGIEDAPAEQRQSVVVFDPSRDGHLLATGERRSGRSGLLALVQRQCPDHLLLPADAEGAWDAIAALAVGSSATEPRVVLLDDLDALPGRFDDEHRAVVLERLVAIARRGSPALVATAARVTAELRSLATLFTRRLLLRMGDRHEYVSAGGDSALWCPDSPPGAGVWSGHRIQLADAGPLHAASAPEPPVASFEGPGAVLVTRRPRLRAEALRAHGLSVELLAEASSGVLELGRRERALVLVGDPDDWQSRWSVLGRLRETCPIYFDGCSAADMRLIGRSSEPPPAVSGPGRVLALHADGTWRRLRWLSG